MTASIDNLVAVWASLDPLLAGLTEEEWKRPTGCPGWSVQDNVAHLVDYEAKALGWEPRAAAEGAWPPHVKNPLGAANEHGIAARRHLAGRDVLAELRKVTAARVEQLRDLGAADLAREIDLPIGRGTVADMLTLRVMDTWSHEQDIRRAVGRPGHESGPVVDEAVGYFSRFLPLVVAKRAGAPESSAVAFEIDGRPTLCVVVRDGRGALAGAPAAPDVTLRMTAGVFDALVCGRSDVSAADVGIEGDDALGERVVAAMGFMP